MASTYSALGLVQALVGDYEAAVVSLHKALSLHRDHTTATTLLHTVMEQLTAQTPTFQGVCVSSFLPCEEVYVLISLIDAHTN